MMTQRRDLRAEGRPGVTTIGSLSCAVCRELSEEISMHRMLAQRLAGLPGHELVERVARRLARRAAFHAFFHRRPRREPGWGEL